MDDILKAYGRPGKLDEFMELIDFDPELGFNPYFWISRRAIIEASTNLANRAAYERYRESLKRLNTAEMLKGQAFGL